MTLNKKKSFLEILKETANKHPQMINDIAVLLFTMGYMDLALEFLEDHLDHFSRKWMFIDFLMESQNYLQCLDYIDRLYPEYEYDSDMTFELSYFKAYSYYGLKEYEKAENLAQDLMAIRPEHQAIKTLFLKCKTEKEI